MPSVLDHQQFHRHTGFGTERLKGAFAKGSPAVIGGTVDEGERDHPAPDRLTQSGQRKSGIFQRLDTLLKGYDEARAKNGPDSIFLD